MTRGEWLIVAVIAGVLLIGGAVVVVKGRSDFLLMVGGQAYAYLSAVRPDLSDARRLEAAAIVAAHAAHETDFGSTPAWKVGWNFGNITAGAAWTGPVVNAGDLEYSGDGEAGSSVKRITQAFRAYPNLDAAVTDYFRLLEWPRYRPALNAMLAGDLPGFVSALRAGGYYTASASSYLAGLASALPAARSELTT